MDPGWNAGAPGTRLIEIEANEFSSVNSNEKRDKYRTQPIGAMASCVVQSAQRRPNYISGMRSRKLETNERSADPIRLKND